jgi:ComEC/Rec2-related protein
MFSLVEKGERVMVSGVVFATRSPVKATYGELKHRFRLRDPVVSFHEGDPGSPLHDSLAVVWYGKRPERGGYQPRNGDRIEVFAKVCARREYEGDAPELDDVFLVGRERGTTVHGRREGALGLFAEWRESAAERITLGLDKRPEERALLLAMTLGYRSDLPQGLTRAFRRAGTIHIFAISGLHVVVIAGIIAWLIEALGVRRAYVVFPLAPFLALYVYATGAQPSAMRAALMTILYFIPPLLDRRPDPYNTIALTLLALLVPLPLQLRGIGFILSFAMVTGLVFTAGAFQNAMQRLTRVETLREEDVFAWARSKKAPATWLGRIWASFAAWFAQKIVNRIFGLVSLVSISLAAALVSLPLTAYFFGYFTLYSLLANLVVVPLATVVMVSSGLGLLASCLWPAFAVPFNAVSALGAWAMESVSVFVASLPGSSPKTDFPLWGVLLWYLLLGLLCWWLRKRLPEPEPEEEAVMELE